MVLSGRRILFVVPSARFAEAALYQTWQLLAETGAWLLAAGDSPTGRAVGEEGSSLSLGARLEDVDPADFDAIVVVPGSGPVRGLERIARAAAKAGVPVLDLADLSGLGALRRLSGELRG